MLDTINFLSKNTSINLLLIIFITIYVDVGKIF